MLNITIIKRQGLGGVSSYYADGADDYYAKDGSAMQWQGEGAEALGLSGEVDPKQFKELLDGRLPDGTVMKRFSSERSKERIGYDFTLSAPKSVSLQALVHGDASVLAAHNKAVEAAMKEAETLAQARSTIKGKTSHEQTGNLVIAKFRHETSREVDPNLHTHAIAMNMTQRADGKWRAVSNEAMLHSLNYLGNVYKATLAQELEKQGFTLRHDAKSGTFELAHITPEQIAEFSKRSEQVEAQLAKQGLTRESATTEQKNAAALMTRAKKGEIDRETVHKEWKQRAIDLGIEFDARGWAGVGLGEKAPILEAGKSLGTFTDLNLHADGSYDDTAGKAKAAQQAALAEAEAARASALAEAEAARTAAAAARDAALAEAATGFADEAPAFDDFGSSEMPAFEDIPDSAYDDGAFGGYDASPPPDMTPEPQEAAQASEAAPEQPRSLKDITDPQQVVTIYRGEGPGNETSGQWWTFDREKAQRYAEATLGGQKHDGVVREVSIKAGDLARISAVGHGGKDEIVVFDPARLSALAVAPEPAQKATTTTTEAAPAPEKDNPSIAGKHTPAHDVHEHAQETLNTQAREATGKEKGKPEIEIKPAISSISVVADGHGGVKFVDQSGHELKPEVVAKVFGDKVTTTIDEHGKATHKFTGKGDVGIELAKAVAAASMTELDTDAAKNIRVSMLGSTVLDRPIEYHADQAVDFAIQKLTERQAIANRSKLFDEALAHGFGVLSSDDVKAAITRARADGRLIEEQPLYVSMNANDAATNANGTKDNRTDGLPPKTRQEWINDLVAGGKTKEVATKLVDMGIEGGRLKRVETRYTTQAATHREREILSIESRGRGAIEQRIDSKTVKEFIESYRLGDAQAKAVGDFMAKSPALDAHRDLVKAVSANKLTREQAATLEAITGIKAGVLSQEQGQAVKLIAETPNRFIAVPGLAGTGKSFMTEKAANLLTEQGYKVVSLAPYAKQVKALQEIGLEARTVASFLATQHREAKDKDGSKLGESKDGKNPTQHRAVKHEKLTPDHVVFIDEAGVIPARQMRDLMKEIEKAGARAVFLGDTQQTKAIEAGRPLDQLLKAGMEHTTMTDIQRQKNAELLQAVRYAVEGRGAESLDMVNRVSAIVEKKDGPDRYAAIVDAYVSLTPEQRRETLVITGTNDSRKQINDGIQTKLDLKGKGEEYDLLNRLDTTQAERRHSKYFTVGSKIIPEADYQTLNLARGKQYTVTDTGPGNRLTVRDEKGELIQFNPAQAKKLSVYSTEKTSLAPGDLVKITHNDRDPKLDLSNGDRFKVEKVTKDTITLVTGKEGGKDFKRVELDAKKPLYVALDYASTVHSAQGLTADRVLINLETGSRTTAKDVFYVAISRARHEAVVFTDSLAKLPAAIQRETEKFAALELSRAQDGGKFKIANMLHQKAMQAKEAAGIDGKGALSGIEKALHKAGVGQQGTEKGGPAHNKEKNRDSIGFGQ